MTYYLLNRDDKSWGKLYSDDVVAEHKWSLPGIICPQCGQTWAWTGFIYPVIDLTGTTVDTLLVKARPAHFEEFEALQAELRQYVPDHLPTPPGTTFGPLLGKAKGKIGDFAWPDPWTMLMRREAYSPLLEKSVRMPKYSIAQLNFGKSPSVELLEPQIEPGAYLYPTAYSLLGPACSLCGRKPKNVNSIILDKVTIPNNQDLFRVADFPTHIICTENLMRACEELNLSNITFTPVEVA